MKKRFQLQTSSRGSVRTLPNPPYVLLTLCRHNPIVSVGDSVALGQRIAEATTVDFPDVHASVCGIVSSIADGTLRIDTNGDRVVPPISILQREHTELKRALLRLGVDMTAVTPARILVINAVEPEPDISVYGQLLEDDPLMIAEGLRYITSLVAPEKTILVMAKGASGSLPGVQTKRVAPVYPAGLDPLVVKAATGKEMPNDVCVVSIPLLFEIGCVMKTGLPFAKTIFSVNSATYQASVGTPAEFILREIGRNVRYGDRVFEGGALRGSCMRSLDQGLQKGTYGLGVVKKHAYPAVEDAPCMSCGECVLVCPSRIDPGMLSRYAEFGLFEKAEAHHLHACMDCGLCGYVCVSRRPVVQYLRLAKAELAKRQCESCSAS